METNETSAGALTLTRKDKRTFNDIVGQRWLVYERPRGTGRFPLRSCLIFESLRAVRRVYAFPPEWRALDAAALARLSRMR